MRTELRILTGRHAGARVLLDSQQLTIGSDDDADIQITDWSDDALILETEDANVFYSRATTDLNAAKTPFPVLNARRFGSVVLCIGPADASWPSELTLLQEMMAPSPANAANIAADGATSATAAIRTGPQRRHAHLARIALISLAAASLVAWHAYPTTPVITAPDPQLLLDRLQIALLQIGLSDVHGHRANNDIVIDGFVRNREEQSRLQQWLDGHPGPWRSHVYNANTIAQAMDEALGVQSLQVSYVGHGVFRISGTTANSNAIKQRIAQIATDFSDQIAGIEWGLTTIDPQRQLPRTYASALAQHGLYYVETPDGTKHFNFQSDSPR